MASFEVDEIENEIWAYIDLVFDEEHERGSWVYHLFAENSENEIGTQIYVSGEFDQYKDAEAACREKAAALIDAEYQGFIFRDDAIEEKPKETAAFWYLFWTLEKSDNAEEKKWVKIFGRLAHYL